MAVVYSSYIDGPSDFQKNVLLLSVDIHGEPSVVIRYASVCGLYLSNMARSGMWPQP